MTVGDLINELQRYDDNMEVVMNATNSCYVDEIRKVEINEVAHFYGDVGVGNMLIITPDGQIGTIYS